MKTKYKYAIFSKKFVDIGNLIFAFYIALIPGLLSLFSLIGFNSLLNKDLLVLFTIMYLIFLLFTSVDIFVYKSNIRKFLKNFKKPPVIIVLVFLFWVLLASIINNSFNISLLYIFTYVFIFLCFSSLNKKHIKLVVNTAIVVVVFSCILGFFDPMGLNTPGFRKYYLPFSLQFENPNYIASVVAILMVVILNFFNNSKKWYEYVLYSLAFLILTFYIFLNGTYSAITAFILASVFNIIFLWVKNKKCPWKMILLFSSLFPIMFLVDLYPNIPFLRTCDYNFFLETCAIIDNIFGTDFLGLFNIDYIVGSDGWGRGELIGNATDACFSSFRNFFFGLGAGNTHEFRPHNNYIALFLEYGFFAMALYATLIVYYFYKVIKSRFNANNFGYICAVIAYLFRSMFGSIIAVEYIYFLIVFAISVNLAEDKTKIESNKIKSNIETQNHQTDDNEVDMGFSLEKKE